MLPHNSSYSVGGVMRCSVAIQKFTVSFAKVRDSGCTGHLDTFL